MVWHGNLLLSLLFVISVKELAVMYDLEVAMRSAFLAEHLAASLGG